FTWLYNNTGGSIFAALIFHTMLNLSTYVVFPVFEMETGPTYYFFSIIVVAVIISTIFGTKRMIREKSQVKTENKRGNHFGWVHCLLSQLSSVDWQLAYTPLPGFGFV
ncbi:MAG: hypothetical protein N3E47_08470, partial [Candidatus Bathyarchaeota archaeon]|nr:hypothetical protein [Candidatus Bathyarchaeota archaeon]